MSAKTLQYSTEQTVHATLAECDDTGTTRGKLEKFRSVALGLPSGSLVHVCHGHTRAHLTSVLKYDQH